jgi:hypothetical protein
LYSRFKLEICADQEKYQELNHQVEQMKSRSIIVPDDAHALGMIQFPNLPFITKDTNAQILSNNISDENYSELQENIDQDQRQEKNKLGGNKFSMEQQNAMKEKIGNITFPGIKLRQIVLAHLFIGGYLIPILTLLFIFPTIQSESEKPLVRSNFWVY